MVKNDWVAEIPEDRRSIRLTRSKRWEIASTARDTLGEVGNATDKETRGCDRLGLVL